jgi:biotin carboxylase
MKKDSAILFVGGGIETLPGVRLAKAMGLHVVVSDAKADAPCMAEADGKLIVSTYDVQGSVAEAGRYHREVHPLAGVICLATDVPVTVATIAANLGLSGHSIASAELAADKLAMKDRFVADGVPVPWYAPVPDVSALRRFVSDRGYPLVLKPVDSRGARGVLRLTEDVELDWAYNLSHSYSPSGQVMVEEFLSGPQISTESIMLDGTAFTPGFSDRNYEYIERYAPHMIENGGELPSYLSVGTQEAIGNVVEHAALSMGMKNGVVKGDIVVHDGKPYVIELAARLSGGYFCTHEIPLSTGVNFVQQAILLALGDRPAPGDLKPRYQKHVAQRYLFPKPGRIVSISGVAQVHSRLGIALCDIRVAVGDIIGPIESHPARAGVVITTADTREEAIERAVAAIKDIQIETIPLK